MKRRTFVKLLGSTALATAPLFAHAQQPMPVVALVRVTSEADSAHLAAALRAGLEESGYVAGQNVAMEYRGAQYRYDRLPALAVDLVSRQVAVIVAVSTQGALAAKAATRSDIKMQKA